MAEKFNISYWTLSSALFLLLGIFVFEEVILYHRGIFLCYIFFITALIIVGMAPLFAERDSNERDIGEE